MNADIYNEKHNDEKFKNLIQVCIEENKRTLVVKHHNVKYNGKRKTGKSVPPWDTFFDVSKTREFWVVFSKYGEYNGKKPGCGIQNQINSGRKY